MRAIEACLHGGPRDGERMAVPEGYRPYIEFAVAKPIVWHAYEVMDPVAVLDLWRIEYRLTHTYSGGWGRQAHYEFVEPKDEALRHHLRTERKRQEPHTRRHRQPQ